MLPPRRVARVGVVTTGVVVPSEGEASGTGSSTVGSSPSSSCFDLARLKDARVVEEEEEDGVLPPLPPVVVELPAALFTFDAAVAPFLLDVGVVGAETLPPSPAPPPLLAPPEPVIAVLPMFVAIVLMLLLLPLFALPSEGVGESAVTDRAFFSRVAIAFGPGVLCPTGSEPGRPGPAEGWQHATP